MKVMLLTVCLVVVSGQPPTPAPTDPPLTIAPDTSAPPTPFPATPSPPTPAPPTPSPPTPAPPTPSPPTPSPPTPAPPTPAPPTPIPPTLAPPTAEPTFVPSIAPTVAPPTSSPPTPAPPTDPPATPAPPTPSPPTPSPPTPAPPTPSPPTPSPPTPFPPTVAPPTPAPPTDAPATPAPDTIAPTIAPTLVPTLVPTAEPTVVPDTPAPPIDGCDPAWLTLPAGAVPKETACDPGMVVGYSGRCEFLKQGFNCTMPTCGQGAGWSPAVVSCFATGEPCDYTYLYEPACDAGTAECVGIAVQFATKVWSDSLFVSGAATLQSVFDTARDGAPTGALISTDVCRVGYTLNETNTFICNANQKAVISGQLCNPTFTSDTPTSDAPPTPAPIPPTVTLTEVAVVPDIVTVTESLLDTPAPDPTATLIIETTNSPPTLPAPSDAPVVTPTLVVEVTTTLVVSDTAAPAAAAPNTNDSDDPNILVIILVILLVLLCCVFAAYCVWQKRKMKDGGGLTRRQSVVSRADEESLADPEALINNYNSNLREKEMGRLPSSKKGPKTWVDDDPYVPGEENTREKVRTFSEEVDPTAPLFNNLTPAATPNALEITTSTPGGEALNGTHRKAGSGHFGKDAGGTLSVPLLQKEKDDMAPLQVPDTSDTIPLITSSNPRSAPKESRSALRSKV